MRCRTRNQKRTKRRCRTDLRASRRPSQRKRGFLLLLVLLVVAAISLGALAYSRSMLTGHEESLISGESVQARYAADSGIDAARLFLAYSRAQRDEKGGTYSNASLFQAIPILQGRGIGNICNYSLVAPDMNEDGKYSSVRFGLHNESARLNVNVLPIIDSQMSIGQALQQVAGQDLSAFGIAGGGGAGGSGFAIAGAGGGSGAVITGAATGSAGGGSAGAGGASAGGGSMGGASSGSSMGSTSGASNGGSGASSGGIGRSLLMALPGMNEEIADAILDFVDADDDPREFGAERDYYATLPTPYAPVNGPLQSIEQLLLVRGVTPQLLFGYDQNRNGVLDDSEKSASLGLGGAAGSVGTTGSSDSTVAEEDIPDLGWAIYLTLYSKERNAQADGSPRININSTDMTTFQSDLESAVGADLATFIIAYRYLANTQQPGAGAGGVGVVPGVGGQPGQGPNGGGNGRGDGNGRGNGGPGDGPGGRGGPGGPGGPGGQGGGRGPGGGGPGGPGGGGPGGPGGGPGGGFPGRGGRSQIVMDTLPFAFGGPGMLVSFLQQGGRGGAGQGPGAGGPGGPGGGFGGGRGPGGPGGGFGGGQGGPGGGFGGGQGGPGGGFGGGQGGPGGRGGRGDGPGRGGDGNGPGGGGNGRGGNGMGGGVGMPGVVQPGAGSTKTMEWKADLFETLSIDTSQPPPGTIRQVLQLIGAEFTTTDGNGEQVTFKSPLEASPIAMALYLPMIMDKLTAVSATSLPGRININEAPREILRGLPGISDEVLDQLIEARAQSADNENRKFETWPMVEGIITLQEMQTIAPLITGGGDCMRVQSIGYFEQSAGFARTEAVIDASGPTPTVVLYRKMDHLGRGFSQSTLGQRGQVGLTQ